MYKPAVVGLVAVFLYQVLGLKWLSVPWPILGLLGTATAFTVGFKNTQPYQPTAEGQKIWASIIGTSRYWGIISRDFFINQAKAQELGRFRRLPATRGLNSGSCWASEACPRSCCLSTTSPFNSSA